MYSGKPHSNVGTASGTNPETDPIQIRCAPIATAAFVENMKWTVSEDNLLAELATDRVLSW